ncbi:hypothetical protein [Floridanema aerugineum]|uniref:CopG family transcriptional regulator n=1 Tax=Floridaenema aerugineum BLCC-F46 TaxID=3153654 RepID=A0ABV4X1W5_9CYAN
MSELSKFSEAEIDEIVIAEADDDSAWEAPIQVSQKQPNFVQIPSELAARIAFVANLHSEEVQDWIARIIKERIELEESAFSAIKRELVTKKVG